MKPHTILVLNGPNLNLLGTREPGYYGTETLEQVMRRVRDLARAADSEVTDFQSNAEHALIDKVHAALADDIDFIIINPAGLTHASVSLRDALKAVSIPFIEVHLSNVHAREEFRRHSYFSDIAVGVITGLGPIGYELALQAALRYLDDKASGIAAG